MARTRVFTPKGRTDAATAVIAESLTDLADWMAERRVIPSGWGLQPNALQHLLTGDSALVSRAEALLSKIEAESPVDTSGRETVRVVAGGMADVPAYLSGTPVNMRRRQRVDTPAPLRIVLDVTSSAMVNNATLERRGVATLALLRKLEAAGHAVELWAVEAVGDDGRNGFCFVRIETRPLDLSRACWALASVEFSRQVGISACNTTCGMRMGAWVWGNKSWNGDYVAQRTAYAAGLDVEPESILAMPPMYSDDSIEPFKSDDAAVAWVNRTYVLAVAQSLHSAE